jgi:DNA adenine methylase
MRYHGAKWRIAPWIISHFPKHKVYVEPFGGSGSVLLRKPRSEAEIYNDLDGQIVNVFRVIRDPAAAHRLERLLRLTPYARAEFDNAHESTEDPVEQARRTIVLAAMGHGSVLRKTGFKAKCWLQNRSGALTWSDYPQFIDQYTARLRGVVIECRPGIEVMQQHDSPETLFYIDPPYMLSTRSAGAKGNYRNEFDDDDHRELLRVIRSLAGSVLVSSYDAKLYRDILHDWRVETMETYSEAGAKRTEVLWISPNVPPPQLSLGIE